jgi:hypothetical protein
MVTSGHALNIFLPLCLVWLVVSSPGYKAEPIVPANVPASLSLISAAAELRGIKPSKF